MNDHLDCVTGVATEMLLRQLPHLHRLRTVRLPARTGEILLHKRRENPQPHNQQHPHRRDNPAMLTDPDAKAPQRAGQR